MAVAATITAVCLVGVYGVLQKCLRLEADVAARQRDRSAAKSLADSLAGAIEDSVVIRGRSVEGGAKDDGTQFLDCFVSESGVQRRLYRWGFPAGSGGEGRVELRIIRYAGGQPLLPNDAEAPSGGDEELWARATSVVVAHGIVGLSVQYCDAGATVPQWSSAWKPSSARMLAKVRVTVGKQTIERLASPEASAPLVE